MYPTSSKAHLQKETSFSKWQDVFLEMNAIQRVGSSVFKIWHKATIFKTGIRTEQAIKEKEYRQLGICVQAVLKSVPQ